MRLSEFQLGRNFAMEMPELLGVESIADGARMVFKNRGLMRFIGVHSQDP